MVLLRFSGIVFLLASLGCATAGRWDESAAREAPPLGAPEGSGEGIRGELSSRVVPDASIVRATVRIDPEIDPGDESRLRGSFEGREFPLYASPREGSGVYEGIFAVPYLLEPGKYPVIVNVDDRAGAKLTLTVREGEYRSERLRVDPSKVSPPEEVIPRLKSESEEVNGIYARITRDKMWRGPFRMPVKSAVTSPFGTKRLYNGQLKGFHRGLDLRARTGKGIRAPEKGRVVLAKDLYFTGNTVILDHGYGVYTVYAHLSRFKVKSGDTVEPGQVIGLAGATGRVNGPHLHWSAVIHGERVNPMDLTKVMR